MSDGLERVSTEIMENMGIKKSYSCPKCANTEDFRITIENEWSDLFRGSMSLFGQEHVISKTYTLECLVCHYKIIARKVF